MTAAEDLAAVEADLERHWWAIALHQHAIRELLPRRDTLRAAVAREEAKELRQARKYCGPDVRRSA